MSRQARAPQAPVEARRARTLSLQKKKKKGGKTCEGAQGGERVEPPGYGLGPSEDTKVG